MGDPAEPDSRILELRLEAHLTEDSLRRSLDAVGPPSPGSGMLVDCVSMTGYDAAARACFVQWNSAQRDSIDAVAVVTDKTIWHMIVTAMGLASRQKMKAFTDADAARGWLAEMSEPRK